MFCILSVISQFTTKYKYITILEMSLFEKLPVVVINHYSLVIYNLIVDFHSK